MSSPVIQLKCQCNNYPWGKQGKESIAAQYAASTPGNDFVIDESKAYAEMWMGTYPLLPARVLASDELLQDVLNANAEALIGKPVLTRFGTQLPYLPKIFSIQKALPLQIHPDRALAAKLHQQDPGKYTDENHKPEIAVALGPFEAFVGWKPIEESQSLFCSLDVLRKNFGPYASVTFTPESIKHLTRTMLLTSDETVKSVLEELMSLPKEAFGKHGYIADLLPRLAEQYSKTDPGSLVALLCMNYITLQAGDAVFIPADGIHAYLSGDIMECMANSNNVINTGFCPRAARDSIDLFTDALTFASSSVDEAMLSPKPSDKSANEKTAVYAPPMSEFNVLRTSLAASQKEVVEQIRGPSVMIVASGSGSMKADGKTHELRRGFVHFIGCGVELELTARDGLETYRAYCEG
ncbi:MAG: hypothetical protein M1817_002656 [Caeruleum heppii]|nr:MAG: hypothetical protein M1817_002656 [Caeruleum heppii]